MEKILGINQLRPNLTKVLQDLATSESPYIITTNSVPKAVLLKYEEYVRLKEESIEKKRLSLKLALAMFGKAATGLTEQDVESEIASYRLGETQ